MNSDDIIRMAKEAGAFFDGDCLVYDMPEHCFEKFAALVAAAEREACARACEKMADNIYSNSHEDSQPMPHAVAKFCAAAIRARGE